MPTVDEIRDGIVGLMTTVPDIGRVHGYQRYETNVQALQGLYRTEIDGVEQLRGWYVSRIGTEEQSPATGRYITRHTWRINGYLALADAATTEKTMDALIEALRDAFRATETLGGLVDTTVFDEGAGLQLDEHLPVMFAGVLCHMARMTLRTQHLS